MNLAATLYDERLTNELRMIQWQINKVREQLRTLNPNEVSGAWSLHDLAEATGLSVTTVSYALEVIRPSEHVHSHTLYSLAP